MPCARVGCEPAWVATQRRAPWSKGHAGSYGLARCLPTAPRAASSGMASRSAGELADRGAALAGTRDDQILLIDGALGKLSLPLGQQVRTVDLMGMKVRLEVREVVPPQHREHA